MRDRACARWLGVLLTVVVCAGVSAQEVRKGEFRATFSEKSPLSSVQEQSRHFSVPFATMQNVEREKNYDLASESFEVFVPESYKADDGWGLLVWDSPSPSGRLNRGWARLLEEHKLIWVGPNKAGNERLPFLRIALCLDARHNMLKQYSIDQKRVFIAGASGGGRVASMIGIAYPDAFAGGIYMIGCNWYRDMPAVKEDGTPDRGKAWHRSFGMPPLKILRQAREESRHVLLTGEHDMNRPQTKQNYEKGFKAEGYKHVIYLEVPGMGHQTPPAEWMGKALDFLDGKDQGAGARGAAAGSRETTVAVSSKMG